MHSRDVIRNIIAGQNIERCGFWMGNPHAESWSALHRYFGTSDSSELRMKLGDDLCWICPQFFPDVYQAPDGRGMFDASVGKTRHGQAGPLAHCEHVAELDDFIWPSPEHLHFDSCLAALRKAGDVYRASGFWTCFYHNVMDLFGMEDYMVKMYTHPDVVEAVTDRICGFYYEANERFYELAGPEMDGFFFGNDFGTQLDLICGPAQFDRFILPWFERFTRQAKQRGYQVILHSCGAIHKVIERLIDSNRSRGIQADSFTF